MKESMTKRAAVAVIALLFALISVFGLARYTTDPAFHERTITSLNEKQTTVMELTAASTAASAAITLLPGDTATPIADKLADLSGYFLIVLCAIFLEKYLLTITSWAAFKLLFPAACVLLAAAALFPAARSAAKVLAWKLTLFALAIFLVIPCGVKAADLIENTYQASIDAAISDAKEATEILENHADDSSQEEEKSGLGGLFSKVTESITGAASNAVEKLKSVLNAFMEALAVMLVTTCLIPILVLLFFVRLMKMLLDMDFHRLTA